MKNTGIKIGIIGHTGQHSVIEKLAKMNVPVDITAKIKAVEAARSKDIERLPFMTKETLDVMLILENSEQLSRGLKLDIVFGIGEDHREDYTFKTTISFGDLCEFIEEDGICDDMDRYEIGNYFLNGMDELEKESQVRDFMLDLQKTGELTFVIVPAII